MPVEEKRARMRLLRDVVRTYSVQVWAEAFLNSALASGSVSEAKSGGDSSGQDTGLPLIASAASPDQRIA
jgi:trehalose-6-phosphate synthase